MKTRYTKIQSKEEIRKLVEQFQSDFHDIRNPQMKEAQLEDKYIKPLFSFLNWNIHTTGIKKGMEEFRVQTSQRIKKSTKQPDYELWLPEKENPEQMKRHLFMEAKDPKYDLQKNVQWMRQAYQYAHSTLSLSERSNKRTNLSILTDFEEFRLFDCRYPDPLTKSDASLYNKYVLIDLRYTDYLNKFDKLWETFERDNVQNGSLAEFEITDKELKKNRIAPDLKFLDDLKQWRLDFARSMYKSNKSVSNEHLTSATQTLINRIIFLKMLTDRKIEDDYLTKILEQIENEKEEISIYDSCRDIFKELDKKYNGDIFHRKTDLDDVIVENKVFKKILKSLRPEKSVYTLNAMPVEIIGNVYEQFLGDVIVHKGRGIAAEPKPEVRKAGGVYYTPKYIVDYIVQNTAGEKLKKCKSPKDVEKIKIVDPACGSGSFLLGAYDVLVEWHLNYFKHQVDNLLKKGNTLKEINKKYIIDIKCYPIGNDDSDKYSLHLTSKLKKQILTNNLFGVDIDNNAVEITKFSLSMKALEDTTYAELYEDLDLFHQTLLPELKDNIKCGNALIGSDYFDGQNISLFDDEEAKKVNAFDWDAEFPEVFSKGGFDCVIGNPPWGALFSDNELNFLKKTNSEIIVRMIDSFMYFVYNGIKHVNSGGLFGMILPDVILYQKDNEKLRKWLISNCHLNIILNMGDVFENVTRPTSIIVISKSKSRKKVSIADFSDCKKQGKDIVILNKNRFQLIDHNFFNSIPNYQFITRNPNHFIIVNKTLLIPNEPLESFVDKDGIQRGVSPDLKKAFLVSKKEIEKFNLEKPFLKNVLTGGKQVKRFYVNYEDLFLIYTTRNDNPKVIPNINEFINSFKSEITCKEVKDGKHPIYALHRPRNKKIFLKETKLLGVITSDKIIIGIDNNQIFTTDGLFLFGLKKNSNRNYLLGVLNSKLFVFLYRLLTAEKGRVLAQVKPTIISQMPIRKIDFDNKKDKSHHNKMVVYVDTILELNKKLSKMKTEHEKTVIQRQIDATDKKIDQLVYKLYDLTEKEIAIVEENVR